jgi:hypothetical protein
LSTVVKVALDSCGFRSSLTLRDFAAITAISGVLKSNFRVAEHGNDIWTNGRIVTFSNPTCPDS